MNHCECQKTHPWISFRFDVSDLTPKTLLNLGEILSKCEHVAGAPLKPGQARDLNVVFLTKGVHATTSIEGNTLDEESVRQRITGGLNLPESLEYQGAEIDNLLDLLNEISTQCQTRTLAPLTVTKIQDFNRRLLREQPLSEDVTPGQYRTHSVLVGSAYRGAPASDCEYLMDRFIQFIGDLQSNDSTYGRPLKIIRAILAHIYLAWIHPFGDGNGRTARLIEFQLLIESGVPVPAAHLLSDFYNRTRALYYQKLENASKRYDSGGLIEFIDYAVQGFTDSLREQVKAIQSYQLELAWTNYIHEIFTSQQHTAAQQRRRALALAMPWTNDKNQAITKRDIPHIDTEIARLYAGVTTRAISRDVNELLKLELIQPFGKGYRSNQLLMAAFLPPSNQDI